jgi:hypothetical protein
LLDAPDEVLLARINDREQGHQGKGVAAGEGLRLIQVHREAYGQVLELIERLGRPRLLRYDTATMSSSKIAGELAEIFELSRAQELTGAPRALNVIEGRKPHENE